MYGDNHPDSASSPRSDTNSNIDISVTGLLESDESRAQSSSRVLDLTTKSKKPNNSNMNNKLKQLKQSPNREPNDIENKNFFTQHLQQQQQQQQNKYLLFNISTQLQQQQQHQSSNLNHQNLGQLNKNTNSMDFLKSQSNNQTNILQNLEANQLFTTYLNQLKFPYNLNQIGSGYTAANFSNNRSHPSTIAASSNFNAEDLSLKSMSTPMKNAKKTDVSQLNRNQKSNQSSRDVLDLSLPNRARQLKERGADSFLTMKSSISSSTISSLSPQSSISTVSDKYSADNTDKLYDDDEANKSIDSETKPINLKKNLNRKRTNESGNCQVVKKSKIDQKSDRTQSPLSGPQEDLLLKASNLLSTLSSQQNLINLLSMASSPYQSFSTDSANQQNSLLNQISHTNLYSNINLLNGMNPFFNQKNAFAIKQESSVKQEADSQKAANPYLDQFVQYSHYMKIVENYQKNLTQNDNASTTNTFNQAGLGTNNCQNSLLNLSKNSQNASNESSSKLFEKNVNINKSSKTPMDATSQPLALVMSNSRN